MLTSTDKKKKKKTQNENGRYSTRRQPPADTTYLNTGVYPSILYCSQEGVLYYVYERKTKGFLTWKIYHCH